MKLLGGITHTRDCVICTNLRIVGGKQGGYTEKPRKCIIVHLS